MFNKPKILQFLKRKTLNTYAIQHSKRYTIIAFNLLTKLSQKFRIKSADQMMKVSDGFIGHSLHITGHYYDLSTCAVRVLAEC